MPKPKKNTQNNQHSQNNQNNKNNKNNQAKVQEVIEEDVYTEDLETEDDIADAFQAQPTIEDKFFYTLNYGIRNNMIMQSGEYISEKERMELGMPKDPQVTFMLKKNTDFQSAMQHKLQAIYYNRLADEFFKDEDKNTEVTLMGCVKFFESMGSLYSKLYSDVGKRYDEVSRLVPKEGNTPEDLHYKTKYLLKNGLSREGFSIIESTFFIENMMSIFIENSSFYSSGRNQKLNLSLGKFLNKEIDDCYFKDMNELMTEFQITDPEERENILKTIGVSGDVSIEEVELYCRDHNKNYYTELRSAITTAWCNQGLKKKLKSMSKEELQEYKVGVEVNNTGLDKKYKKWMSEEGDEILHDLKHNTYKDDFNKCNNIIKSTKPIGFTYPKEGEMLSFSELEKVEVQDIYDKRWRFDAEADIKYKKSKEDKIKAEDKYREYVLKHIGKDKIRIYPGKNVEMLSKAMAANMLSNSKHINKYNVDIIHDMAKKIKISMNLSKVPNEVVNKALESSEGLNAFIKQNVKDLYTPTDPHQLIYGMKDLGKYMMSGRDRSIEYRNLVKAIKAVGNLNADALSDDAKAPKIIDDARTRGFEVLKAVEAYVKGKKSVRHSEDGRDRFDNALDALAILKKTIPGMKDNINLIVERINVVRRSANPKSEYHVDLEKYGVDRAKEAKKKRSLRDQGIVEEKKEVKKQEKIQVQHK